MDEQPTWTDADQAQAAKHGWGLVTSDRDDRAYYLVPIHTYNRLYKTVHTLRPFIWREAQRWPNSLAAKALAYLAATSRPEYDTIKQHSEA